jgi:agmatinase
MMNSAVKDGFTSVVHGGLGGTYMRVPYVPAEAAALKTAGAQAAIYGMPWDATSISRSGASYGPRGIREVSCQFMPYNATIDFYLDQELHLVDCGDCNITLANAVSTFAKAEADVHEILSAGAIPVVLGGDHSITIPVARALGQKYDDPSLVIIDSHLDTANDVGGELLNHCTEVARAMDAGFSPSRIVLVGHNGWLNPPEELEFCRTHGIKVIWLEDIWEHGVAEVNKQIATVIDGSDGVYLSVDVDGLDAAHVVGTSVPASIGLTAREAISLVRGIAACGLTAFDVVEAAPSLDPTSATALFAGRVVLDALASHVGADWQNRVDTAG